MKEFKTKVRAFHKVMRALTSVWDNPKYMVIEVLIQNLGFDSSDYTNYNEQREKLKVNNIIKALEVLSTYEDSCYLSKYVYQEVSDLYYVYVVMGE